MGCRPWAAQSLTRLSVHARGGDGIVDKDVGGRRLFPLSPPLTSTEEPMPRNFWLGMVSFSFLRAGSIAAQQ